MELHDKINSISDKLEYISANKEYANELKYAINTVNNSVNLESVCVLVNVTLDILEEKRDYRDNKIVGLQNKVSKLENEVVDLKNKNVELTNEIRELKTDITELKKKFFEKEEKEYIITLIQACRNIECYIIKQFVNWTNDEIRNCGINKFKRDYPQYLAEVQNMEDDFGLAKNRKNIGAINEKRKLYAHPNPVDTDELEKACDKFYGKYPGLTDLYKGYMKYYELVRPADDE